MKREPVIAALLLLFGPAVVTLFSRTAGLITGACAVAVLVYLVLKDERSGRPGG